jgi:hypothetical protein
MKALDRGDCATASDRLWRAHDLVHVPTLAFYAGKCLEKLGRLVDAEEKYLEAMRDVVEPGAPAAVKAAQVDAEHARDALLPRIPSVLITLRPAYPDVVLSIDGKPVPPAMIGVKRPIDPGSHVAEIARGGGVVSQKPFSVQEGQAITLEVDVPPPMAGPMNPPYPYAYAYGPRGPMYPMRPPPPPTRRANMGLFVAGAIVAPLGGITALVGFIDLPLSSANGGSQAPGAALIGVGLLAMGGGIAMAVIGGKRIPLDAAPGSGPPATPPVSFEPFVGPTSGVRVRF